MFRNTISEFRLFGSRKAFGTPSCRPAIEALEERMLLCNGMGSSAEASLAPFENNLASLVTQMGQIEHAHGIHSKKDGTKWEGTRREIVQDLLQTQLSEIEQAVTANRAQTIDQVYQLWDDYVRP